MTEHDATRWSKHSTNSILNKNGQHGKISRLTYKMELGSLGDTAVLWANSHFCCKVRGVWKGHHVLIMCFIQTYKVEFNSILLDYTLELEHMPREHFGE